MRNFDYIARVVTNILYGIIVSNFVYNGMPTFPRRKKNITIE